MATQNASILQLYKNSNSQLSSMEIKSYTQKQFNI